MGQRSNLLKVNLIYKQWSKIEKKLKITISFELFISYQYVHFVSMAQTCPLLTTLLSIVSFKYRNNESQLFENLSILFL
jgi:hypothetical protein